VLPAYHLVSGAIRPGVNMLDVMFVAAAIAFFAIGALFVRGCEAM
jgi:hypothetical protein